MIVEKLAAYNVTIVSRLAFGILLNEVNELVETLGWNDKIVQPKKQKELFLDLTTDQQLIVEKLGEHSTIQIDELRYQTGLSSTAMASAILTLELQNIISSLPGKQYQLKA